jgi:outer membrane protein OmpA-like peptidoglycan-associated protein
MLINLLLLPMTIAAQPPRMVDTTLTIYFETRKYIPDSLEQKKLLAALESITDSIHIKEISGYTDSIGSFEANMILAKRRSLYVANVVRERFILDSFEIKSYGEQNPVSPINIAMNRRVEISMCFFRKDSIVSDTSKFQVIRSFKLEHLYFRPDESILEPNSIPYLASVANALRLDQDDIFEIKGHVNWNRQFPASVDSGYEMKMNNLSAERAKVVYDILSEMGISKRRMFWKGMGNTEMIYPNAITDEEKRKNMRVEILVLKKPN